MEPSHSLSIPSIVISVLELMNTVMEAMSLKVQR